MAAILHFYVETIPAPEFLHRRDHYFIRNNSTHNTNRYIHRTTDLYIHFTFFFLYVYI